jgi:hypothetical protein
MPPSNPIDDSIAPLTTPAKRGRFSFLGPFMDWVALAPYIVAVLTAVCTLAFWQFRSFLKLKDDFADYRTHVAENYVTTHQFNSVVEKLFDKLDAIYDKLDKKADKQ